MPQRQPAAEEPAGSTQRGRLSGVKPPSTGQALSLREERRENVVSSGIHVPWVPAKIKFKSWLKSVTFNQSQVIKFQSGEHLGY